MPNRDVVFMKLASIENCLRRIRSLAKDNKLDDLNIQEPIVLNLQRAIQLCIDLGAHLINVNSWRVPITLKETFLILKEEGVIQSELCDKLCKMIGFRNIAIHDYQQLDVAILEAILKYHLQDFEDFMKAVS